jgi:hypothetical protein
MVSPWEVSGKAAEASREAVYDDSDTGSLPEYREVAPRTAAQPEGSSAALGPTVSSPFNFPSSDLPPYSPAAPNQNPIAIPQRWPDPAAPFLPAYSPALLKYGITPQNWSSFLDTMSAFLTARVSKRAISHAGDIATELGRVPQRFGKDVAAHAKQTGRHIATSAKHFNPIGVVGGVVGGAISLTVGTTVRAIGSILHLPGTAIVAAANPQTPRGRAEMYATAANRDWFHPRGLHAQLFSTAELTGLIGVSVDEFLRAAGSQPGNAAGKIRALQRWIGDLEIQESGSSVELSTPEMQRSSATRSPLVDSKEPIDDESAVSEAAEGSRSASGKKPVSGQGAALPAGVLRLGPQTVWLVLFPAEFENVEAEKNRSGNHRSKKTEPWQ